MGKEGCSFITDDKNISRRHLPPGHGEFSVGCVDVMNDPSDSGCFFRLFYPVEKTDIYKRNTQWPLWMPRKQYSHGFAHFLKKNPRRLYAKFFDWLGGDVYVPVLWQAPLHQSSDKYPVMILSHGLGGNRAIYSTFCCEMASYGFVVVAVEHRDGSASMTYHLQGTTNRMTSDIVMDTSSGKDRHSTIHRSESFKEAWTPFEHTDPMGISWDDFDYRNRQVNHRADECIRTLTLLEEMNNGGSVPNMFGFNFSLKQFKGQLDMSRVSVAGHSFGGSTTAMTLNKDPRFKVGLMFDAWMLPLDEETCRQIKQPILMINYEKFQWEKNVKQMQVLEEPHTGGERVMITLLGAGHQAISDFQFLCNRTFGRFMEVRYDLSPRKAMSLNTQASLGFLWKHLGMENKPNYDNILAGDHEFVKAGTTLNIKL